MLFQCELCREDVESSTDDYYSVLIVENHRKEKIHHSFILCDRCYRKIKKYTEKFL